MGALEKAKTEGEKRIEEFTPKKQASQDLKAYCVLPLVSIECCVLDCFVLLCHQGIAAGVANPKPMCCKSEG